jgi:hypothetical protein
VAAQTRTVGVHVGEWFKYGEVSANGTLQAQYQNVESWIMTVTNVSGTNVTVQLVTNFKNETSSSPASIEGDVVGGNGFENSLLVISANLEAHDAIYSSQAFSSYTINETINKAYLHSTRPTNHLMMSNEHLNGEFYWDKATGMLVEVSEELINPLGPETTCYLSFKIVDSSVWVVPEFPSWIPLFALFVALTLIVAAHKRKTFTKNG